MINLITGLPGNGKTLYALAFIKAISEKENRPVFYSGIKDLTLPWTEIDATKWMDCPPHSIVVIDECQTIFRPRSFSTTPPDYVAKLETHRHLGIDIYLITQHPMLADTAIRRLAGNHKHVVRKFGTAAATVHEWGSVKDNCDKSAGRKDSIKHHWGYPKSAYAFYKSAEAHTHKRAVPMKVYVLFVLPFLLALCVWYMVRWNQKKMHPELDKPPVAQLASAPGQVADQGAVKRASYKDAEGDMKQYIFDRTARVRGMDMTAPRYDEVTKPTIAPVPVACVESRTKGCTCYSQQGTRMAVEPATCMQIVRNGFFQDFDDKGGHPNATTQQATVAAPAANPSPPVVVANAVRVSGASEAPKVADTVNLEDGYGVLGKRGQRAPQYR